MWIESSHNKNLYNTDHFVLINKESSMGYYEIRGQTVSGTEIVLFSSSDEKERDEYFERLTKIKDIEI